MEGVVEVTDVVDEPVNAGSSTSTEFVRLERMVGEVTGDSLDCAPSFHGDPIPLRCLTRPATGRLRAGLPSGASGGDDC